MSPPAGRPRAPSNPDDESAVRERATPVPSTPPAAPASAGSSRDRLEAKLRAGRAILAGLPATDERTRLLHIALLRRDEALLDGVLAELGVRDAATFSR